MDRQSDGCQCSACVQVLVMSMMARNTSADVVVVGLVGERGREVREFIENDLGEEGLAKSIVVVATSDMPPMVRLQATFTATRIAEHFRDGGSNVLLFLDSITRTMTAQREVGLSAGEPPASRAYPPSVGYESPSSAMLVAPM